VNKEIQKAYDTLVPADQLVVDALILMLVANDNKIKETLQQVSEFLSRQ
jgi:hypothetical protein